MNYRRAALEQELEGLKKQRGTLIEDLTKPKNTGITKAPISELPIPALQISPARSIPVTPLAHENPAQSTPVIYENSVPAPAPEAAPPDSALVNNIRQKFGDGKIEPKNINGKSYIIHTDPKRGMTYLKPDGVKMTFDESAPIKLGEGGLTGQNAADILKNAATKKVEATKEMEDMMKDFQGK